MSTLADLHQLLQQETGVCRRLLTILKITRQTLAKNDPTPLENCVAQQAAIADEMAAVDAQRSACVATLASAHGLPADATLTQLISKLPADEAAPLLKLVEGFNAIVAEIQQLQQVNATLLQHAMEFVDFNMEMIAKFERQTTTATTYAPPAFAAAGASAYSDAPSSSVLNLNA